MGCYQRNGCLCGASDASESIGCEGQGHDEEVFASAVHREGGRERETERGERDMMKRNSHPEGISQTLRWLEWLSKGNGWQPMHKLIWGNSIERKAVRLSKEDMQGRTGKAWLDKKNVGRGVRACQRHCQKLRKIFRFTSWTARLKFSWVEC